MPYSNTDTLGHNSRGALRHFLLSQWTLFATVPTPLLCLWYVKDRWQAQDLTGGKITLAIVAAVLLLHAIWTIICWVRRSHQARKEGLNKLESDMADCRERIDDVRKRLSDLEGTLRRMPSTTVDAMVTGHQGISWYPIRDGERPHDVDFTFFPDRRTKEDPKEPETPCKPSIDRDGVVRIARLTTTGRYMAALRHYSGSRRDVIPAKNSDSRRFRVGFEYKTSGVKFLMSVRLRHAVSYGHAEARDGKSCVESVTLEGTEWMPFPVTVFDPKNGNADFVVSMDLEKGPGQPGPKDYLYIRNVFVVEEVTPD